jgi:peptide/nickel transport system ATP-binding protein
MTAFESGAAQKPDATGETVFSLSNVFFSYSKNAKHKRHDALKNINLNVYKGESLGIVGESGSGKTTLLSRLLRLAFAHKGNVSFYGTRLHTMTRAEVKAFRSRVQPVFQDPFLSLDPTQRVENIIGEPLSSLRLVSNADEKRARVIAALESVGLDENVMRRFPIEFSGGQRQRIAIARALVTNPEVLIADEPVSALDIITKIEILSLLHTLQQNKNFTLIMVSHDLPVVADVSSRIIVLDAGEIIEDAPTREALANPSPRTKALVDSVISL